MYKILVFLAMAMFVSCIAEETPTSLMDQPEYRIFCQEAVKKASVFQNFRRNPTLIKYVDTLNKQQGRLFVEYIESHYPALTEMWGLFRGNDIVGDPKTEEFGPAGSFASSTLRYVKVAGDVDTFFGPLDKLKVVEIGGGYGGQCRILMQIFNVTDYTIVDLPEALELAKKYLAQYQITTVKFITPDQVDSSLKADLVISNYAFSGYRSDIQEHFIQHLISHSAKGYLLCSCVENNLITPMKPLELSLKLRTLHPSLQSMAEEPKTGLCNWLHVWND